MQTNIFGEVALCGKCGLYKTCKTPRMKASGNGKYKMLIIGEAPGATEDELGRQFVGESGKLLRFLFEQHGYDMDDFRMINSVNCRPPKNKKPTLSQVRYCNPMVLEEIKKFKPNVILLVGEIAVKSIIGTVWDSDIKGISRWRGSAIPDQTFKSWIVSTYHPSYLIRNSYDVSLEDIVLEDIKKALNLLDVSVPDYLNMLNSYEVLTDGMDIYLLLDEILSKKPEYLAFDYETNSLKPYNEEAEIVSISVCFSGTKAYSFPFYDDKIRRKWGRILRDKDIKKVGHNIKFEQVWSMKKVGTRVRGWYWDTMLMAHFIDNRQDITSLDFQTYLYFGIYGYSKKVKKYLRAESGTKLNKIKDANINDILVYNALDSLFTYNVFLKQMEQVGDRAPSGLVNAPVGQAL